MRLSGTKTSSVNQYNGLGDQLYDLGGAKPTLDLNFSSNESLVDSVTGKTLVQHTRAGSGASSATYVDGDGVIRTAVTNLMLRSEEFDNASWLKVNSIVTANATTAPNGTDTADKLIPNNLVLLSSISNNALQTLTKATTAIQYTYSVFAKQNGLNSLRVFCQGASAANAILVTFSLVNGTIEEVIPFGNFSGGLASIFSYGSGWYRCTLTFTTNTDNAITARNIATDSIITSGDGTSGIYLWGAQLEQASTASSYIPTLASAVTRNTDVLSNDITSLVDSTYTALLDVSASDSRLKIEDGTTGFDLPLNGAGRIVMVVDSNITFHFPDNGQATTVLTYAKPSDLRNIDVLSKINETKIKVIAVENGVALQSRIDSWVSGSVSSYFIDTDWGLEGSFSSEFRDSDWDYFPFIDTSNGSDFSFTWLRNNLTSFPLIDTSNGINFQRTWEVNNLTSFPRLNMDNGSDFDQAWRDNNLTTWLPNYFNTCVGTDFSRAWESNAIDQTGVDNILVSINTARLAGVQTGTTKVIGLNGGTNATPSATGQAATDALRADGWTVNLNGY